MKAYKRLYTQVYEFANLYCAYRAARRAKRGRVAVASFGFDLEHNMLELQTQLQIKTYQPRTYHNFIIRELKRRLVSADQPRVKLTRPQR